MAYTRSIVAQSRKHAKARDVPAINRKRGKIEVFQAIEPARKCTWRIFPTAATIFPQTRRLAMSYNRHNAMLVGAPDRGHVEQRTYVDRVVAHAHARESTRARIVDTRSAKTPPKDYIRQSVH